MLSTDDKFKNMVFDNKVGIFSVCGIAFKKIKELLEALGIEVYIKTDNDIFNTNSKEKKLYYAGITRCIKYLSTEGQEKLKKVLSFENLETKNFEFLDGHIKIKNIEDKMNDICNIFKENKILLSNHNEGFEKDFLDFIGYNGKDYQDIINYLKEAKLTNLHSFITDNNIDISINENNKNSILLGFINYD